MLDQPSPSSVEAETFSTVRDVVQRSYENVVLVLQGGGALGSFQGGVVERLDAVGVDVNWVAGISIGAINSAIIAGNPPGRRIEKLRGFWEKVTSRIAWPWLPPSEEMRAAFNQASSFSAMTFGQPGFFVPRFPPPQWMPPGGTEATSYYDTAPLKATLEEFVDFDYLNDGAVRLSVGAVNLRSGNLTYFDSTKRRICPEHIMASGALPPGFPAIEIEGELYWDGGLVSNTPLGYVLSRIDGENTLIFQVDLFSASGDRPRTLTEVRERQKDIQFSSRTRLNTDVFKRAQEMRRTVSQLLDQLPPELRDLPEAKKLAENRQSALVNIMQLIYRRKPTDRDYKDYEFSRNTMLDNWQAGRDVIVRTMRHPSWFELPDPETGVVTHDVWREAKD